MTLAAPSRLVRTSLKFHVQAQGRNQHWAAITVIARIVDVLQTEGGIDSAPKVQRVKPLFDVLSPVVEAAVSQHKAKPPKCQVPLMIVRKCSALAYTPLPREVVNRQLKVLDQFK
jgi:hypothetical protein